MTQVHSLIQKYNVAGPRYTSYPTVPYWQEQDFSLEMWRFSLYVLVNIFIPPDNHDFASSRRCSFTLNQAK